MIKPDLKGRGIAERKSKLITTMHCNKTELHNKRLITSRCGNCFLLQKLLCTFTYMKQYLQAGSDSRGSIGAFT